MDKKFAVSVFGSGSYGSSLAVSIARKGLDVMLWGFDAAEVEAIRSTRRNEKYLPGIDFPDSISLTNSISEAVEASEILLVVVPSSFFGNTLLSMKPFIRPRQRLVWATKGLERKTGRLLGDGAREVLGPDISLAVVSGPTFAMELAKGMPTAIAVASEDQKFAGEISVLLHSGSFRVYTNSDFIGLQVGGAVKNVIAIGAGMSDGLGFGANARTALITRGLAELTRLGLALGAETKTFAGMSGLGDLVLTCTDNQSRNRRFGIAIGRGEDPAEAMRKIGQVVEGYYNAGEVMALAARASVQMPICQQVHEVLYDHKSARQAAVDLLNRRMGRE